MAKAVSARDVLYVLSSWKKIDTEHAKGIKGELFLISREQEELVKPILFALGIDVRFPLSVDVVKHRDLNNNVAIGYRFVGDIRKDREYAEGPLCDIMERISIASWKDPSLGRDMANIMGMRVKFEEGSSWVDHGEKSDDVVPTYEEESLLIKELQEIARSIRGGMEGQSEY